MLQSKHGDVDSNPTMIIGIDGNEANVENRVGVNEYAFQMLWHLKKLQEKKGKNFDLIVYLKNKPLDLLPKETQNFKYKVIPGRGLWILRKLWPYLIKNPDNIDVFFSPNHYTIPFLSIPRVCTIHDLGYLESTGQFTKKDFWQLKLWSAISIIVSKYIISVSEATKRDIVRHYPFSKNKVQVVYEGYNSDKFNLKISPDHVRRIKNRYSIVDDYILFLSTLKPSKNVEGLVEAFSKIYQLFPKLVLVIGGKKGWLYETIYEKVKNLGITDRVIFTDYVDEKDRPAVIRGAKLFAAPSFWEGFGIDVLSAMAAGVPVVASDRGALPEVAGNAGILVNPDEPEKIAEGLSEVLLADKKKYNRIVAAGLLQAKEFSWEKAAEETLEIFKNAISR